MEDSDEMRAGTTRRGRKPVARGVWRAKFLKALCELGNVRLACEVANVDRTAAYHARENDAAFKSQWDTAIEEACDRLEQEAWRRAVCGVDKPVTFQGQITATYLEYSDTLLIQLLKAHRPNKYREQVAHELSGPGGSPIPIDDYSNLSADERRKRIAELEAILHGRGGVGVSAPDGLGDAGKSAG